MTRTKMLNRICDANPCHGREVIEAWSKFWPDDVTLLWLLTHPKRGKHAVSERDRVWLALATDLLPVAARKRVARAAVVRACGYAAKACARIGLLEHAAKLRGVTLRTRLSVVSEIAYDAACAAACAADAAYAGNAAYAAYAAEGKKQLRDCVAEAMKMKR